MKYKLYTTSFKAWDAMIEAIDGASKSIYLEMYIFERDTTSSHDFIGKLKQKARDGVRVVIVADAYGSKNLKNELAKSMQAAGIELIFFSHWLRHIHRKILIVDKKIAFVGGVNIGKEFAHWDDLQLRMKGGIVKRILKSFAYTYEMAGGKDHKILHLKNGKFTAKLKFLIMEHWPTKNIHTLKSHYIEKISNAKKSIQIATPYFTPPRWLSSLLDSAASRGVAIEILIPSDVDLKIMNNVNRHYMNKLNPSGVKFYLSKKMNHAKLLIVDHEEGLIGSQNIDLASFQLNSEVGIFFKEKKLLTELETTIKKWKQNSEIFKPQKHKMRFIDYVILALSKILYPIL
ncbi:MAG: phosphatidylserine/phosphatidylglycerophosphate/cardiolipin synthase family protein [bacterium]